MMSLHRLASRPAAAGTSISRRLVQSALILAASVAAGDANAQAAAPALTPLPAYRAEAAAMMSPAIDLAAPRTPLAMTYAQAAAMRQAGVARTSLDHPFARGGLTGSVGFLCGLQPRLDESSGAGYGFDPHGRFLGARLSRAF